jgi:hypothetical protein
MNRLITPTILLLAALSGCGEVTPPPYPGPYLVDLENQSQFELQELRVHGNSDDREASNLLSAPLAPESRTSTVLDGLYYVTVFRERARGARTIAVTSESPFAIEGADWFELIVFDESFRLLPRYGQATP